MSRKRKIVFQESFIKAMEMLLEHYEGRRELDHCPLCYTSMRVTKSKDRNCGVCPHMTLRGVECKQASRYPGLSVEEQRLHRLSKWVAHRVPQLQQDIRTYRRSLAALKGRKP